MKVSVVVKGDKMTAKGGGKQRTLPTDPTRSFRGNVTTAMIHLVNETGSTKTFPRTETIEVDESRATFLVG